MSPSGDPAAFSGVSDVAVGEVLDAVPKTLHAWVTAMTHRALARLDLFVRTGMRVADGPMTAAQASAADLRRELSEAHHARRGPVKVSRGALGSEEEWGIAIDSSALAHAHRLIAALVAEASQLSITRQRWRAQCEPLHDNGAGYGSTASVTTDPLRGLCGRSLRSSYGSDPASLLERYRVLVTDMSSSPAALELKHLEPDRQVFSHPLSDWCLLRDRSVGCDGPGARGDTGRPFLSAAGWATAGRRDFEQAEHLMRRRLHDACREEAEPDPCVADYTIDVSVLRAFLATHAAQFGKVSCRVCEDSSDVDPRHVPVTEHVSLLDGLARTAPAHVIPTNVVLVLGSYGHNTPVSSFESDVDAGEFLVGPAALDYPFDRSLYYLPKFFGVSTPAPAH
jgi:hypothetical protein